MLPNKMQKDREEIQKSEPFSDLGEFGDVYQGELTTPEKTKIPIAVKTLKVSIFK